MLAIFGSALRDDFGPDSDIDVLVEFEKDHVPGLEFFGMEIEPSEILNRKVDLNTLRFLSPRLQHMLDYAREALTLVHEKMLDSPEEQ